MLRISLFVALGSLIAGCAVLESSVVYHPRSAPPADPGIPLPPHVKDIHLPLGNGDVIHVRWAAHPESRDAILFCHGNAGNLFGRGDTAFELNQKLRQSVLIFDYPGYGRSEGKPSEGGCYQAALAAYEWLVNTYGLPGERITLFGESLGGAVATELASRKPHRALVLVRSFTSVPDVAEYQFPLYPANRLMVNRFDLVNKLPQCQRPVFIAQADKDHLVPFEHGEKMRRACKSTAELRCLEGLGHNDPLPPEFYTDLRKFLERHAP